MFSRIAISLLALLDAGYFTLAAPISHGRRAVPALNPESTAESHVRDATATRAFSGVPITTSDGKCLFVDELSGDFRANLTPVQAVACDGSAGQKWDVLTSAKHNNVPGMALIVNTKTQSCLNFDPRRAAGDTVNMFSCGGRADGGGLVTNSQLFPFDGAAGSFVFRPLSSPTTCLVVDGARLGQANCNLAPEQLFNIGGAPAAPAGPAESVAAVFASTTSNATDSVAAPTSPAVSSGLPSATDVVAPSASSVAIASTTAVETSVPVVTSAVAVPAATGTAVLRPEAVAESHIRDESATRAKTGVAIKTSTGKCLSIDSRSGDFRENLIPVTVQACNGSPGQKFDVITKGKHNDRPGQALIVSGLTNGCLNFDPRRPAGNQVILFSCGGRANGEGLVAESQLFAFDGTSDSIPLTPASSKNASCLIEKAGKIDVEACDAAKPTATEIFTLA